MGKNIVLLSDGTGNSSAKLLKTNVWRVYESLKLTDPTLQVACYDDGVGTSSFKPLALAGGAFGVGLRRNVLRLYRFLCEHYDPGDHIYAFGFSRGAFTIRVLIGLIADQGIIKTRPTGPAVEAVSKTFRESTSETTGTRPEPRSEEERPVRSRVSPADAVYGAELARLSAWAYRHYRRRFKRTSPLVPIARRLRDVVIRAWDGLRHRRPYDRSRNHDVKEVRFLGLWDTVDAYGLPVDELTDGIDRWVWPLSMPNLSLSDKVRKACHVLALDDERNTFHPVLWDESSEPQNAAHIDNERISQVWFAGMHANVGGGYPDDALSYASLAWMTKQAADHGLLFVKELLLHHTDKADPFGRLYDSRSGLKSYYRYNPRRIAWLTNRQVHEQGLFGRRWPRPNPTVTVGRPKIHESVFARISAAPEAYAPIVLPKQYAVVMADGQILENKFETSNAVGLREQAQENVWNLVWWRRAAYFATVAASLTLASRPFTQPAVETLEQGAAARAIAAAGDMLPRFASPWIRYFSRHVDELVIGAAALLVLMTWGAHLQRRITDKMRDIWLSVTPPPGFGLEDLRPPNNWLYKLRTQPIYQGTFAALRRMVLPNVFGIAVLLWLVGVANRAPFELVNTGGWLCTGGNSAALEPTKSAETELVADQPCRPSGVKLEAGARYRIDLDLQAGSVWKDGDVTVPFPDGVSGLSRHLTLFQHGLFVSFLPFRRVWSAPWFAPIARIGDRGLDQYPLLKPSNELTARTSGELFLFVNDAILPVSLSPRGLGWFSYYANNRGRTKATVTKIANPPSQATH
jgi:uncharacterized protein (DUF2235 family)